MSSRMTEHGYFTFNRKSLVLKDNQRIFDEQFKDVGHIEGRFRRYVLPLSMTHAPFTLVIHKDKSRVNIPTLTPSRDYDRIHLLEEWNIRISYTRARFTNKAYLWNTKCALTHSIGCVMITELFSISTHYKLQRTQTGLKFYFEVQTGEVFILSLYCPTEKSLNL